MSDRQQSSRAESAFKGLTPGGGGSTEEMTSRLVASDAEHHDSVSSDRQNETDMDLESGITNDEPRPPPIESLPLFDRILCGGAFGTAVVEITFENSNIQQQFPPSRWISLMLVQGKPSSEWPSADPLQILSTLGLHLISPPL